MKKITISFLFLLALLAVNTVLAQAPNQFKYQAVLRDASGNIIANTAETVVVAILQGGPSGTVVYQETHNITTTAQGIINLNIGAGTVNSGVFANINWGSGPYYVKITIGATVISNSQLLSVPYALYAGHNPPVVATLYSSTWTWTTGSPVYTGSTLTLPQGKWSVQVSILIPKSPAGPPDNLECWVRSTFTDGSGTSTPSGDIIGANLASGYKAGPSWGMVIGTIVINNTSGSSKTYYYWGQICEVYAGSFSLPNFGGSAALENQIIAYPMN